MVGLNPKPCHHLQYLGDSIMNMQTAIVAAGMKTKKKARTLQVRYIPKK